MNSIIIIEDHPVVRDGLTSYFEGTGRWQVAGTASSLAEAKKLIASVKTDIILLDIQLEDGWGLDIIPHLAKDGTQPKAAVYTAFDDFNHISTAVGMGVKAYVTKRRTLQELDTILGSVLQGKMYIEEAAQAVLDNVTSRLALLTERESEIICLAKKGLSNKEIGAALGINYRTVENILSGIYDKTGIRSRYQLVML